MLAPRVGQYRNHQPAVQAGATLPVVYTVFQQSQGASLTYTARFFPDAAGTIRAMNIFGSTTGTVTVDLLKNGVSVLSAVVPVGSAVRANVRSFGSTAMAAAGGPFNTDTTVNRAKLDYEVGDYFEVQMATAAASSLASFALSLTCDEQQRTRVG